MPSKASTRFSCPWQVNQSANLRSACIFSKIFHVTFSYVWIGNHMRAKNLGALGLANAQPPGHAKFANAQPLD